MVYKLPDFRMKVRALKNAHDMQDFARAHSLSAMKTLIEIHEDAAINPEARISAAKYLIDRAWGRSTQTVITDPPDPSKVIDMIEEAEESVGDIMDASMQIEDKVEDKVEDKAEDKIEDKIEDRKDDE